MTIIGASLLIFLLIMATTISSEDAQSISKKLYQPTEKFLPFNNPPKSQRTSEQGIKNLKTVLKSLLKNEDFQPLVISIGHYGKRGEIHEITTRYFRRLALDHYNIDLEKFSNKTLKLPFGLTWIIVIDDFHIFRTKILNITNLWKTSDRYVIFCLDESQRNDEDMLSLFRILWKQRSVSKVLISLMSENFRYIYGYMPFERINEEFGKIRRFDARKKIYNVNRTTSLELRNLKKIRFNPEERYFDDFSNLNNYPIRVTVFSSLMMYISIDEKNHTIYGKLDANVMRLVEKKLSANFIIDRLETNNIDPFKVAIQGFDTDEKSELIFTGYFTKFYCGNFEFTSSIFQDKLCLVAPSSGPVPKFFMPLLPFTNELWFLIIIYNFAVALIWLLLRHFESKIIQNNNERTSVEISLVSSRLARSMINDHREKGLLGFDDYRSSIKGLSSKNRKKSLLLRNDRAEIFNEPPKINRAIVGFFDLTILACSTLQGGKTNTERAFLVGTLFFGVVVIGLYDSYLVSSLSKPIYYPQLTTLRDVAESNRTIVTKYENLMNDIPNDGSPEIEKLRRNVEFLSSDKKTYDMVAYRGMVSLARFSSFSLENLTEYIEPENNRLLLHMVEECPATYFLSYVVRLTSPYLEKINCLLLRIQQAGLIEKWYGDMMRTVKIASSQTKSKRRDKRVKLTLAHLSLTFLGLGIGLFFSTVVFLGELYFASKLRTTTTRLTIRRPQHQRRLRRIAKM